MYRILVIGFIAILASCSKSTPTCSSSEAKELVIKIAGDSPFARGVRMGVSNLNISVESIRTSSHNKDTGSYECAADLHLSGFSDIAKKDYSRTIPVGYRIEISDNSNEFYVTLFGL